MRAAVFVCRRFLEIKVEIEREVDSTTIARLEMIDVEYYMVQYIATKYLS